MSRTATTANRLNNLLELRTLDTGIGPKYTGARKRLRGLPRRRQRCLTGSSRARWSQGERRIASYLRRRGIGRDPGDARRRAGHARQGRGAGEAGSALRSRSVLAEADAEQLRVRADDRPRHLDRTITSGSSTAATIRRTSIAPSWRCRRRRRAARQRVLQRRRRRCMEFDAAGNNVGGWGGPVAGAPYQWPESNHGIVVDHKGFVWIGGNGQPDSHILKFTRDGKFVAQYGKPGARKDPASPADKPVYVVEQPRHGELRPRREDLHRPEGERRLRVRRLPEQARRGHRPRQRQDQAHLGRLRRAADRRQPRTATIRPRRCRSQFRNPMHCAEMSNDGMVYTCDRPNDRVQVFTSQGKFVAGVPHRTADPLRRLGVGHRLLEGPRSSSSSTWPTAPTNTSASSTARR